MLDINFTVCKPQNITVSFYLQSIWLSINVIGGERFLYRVKWIISWNIYVRNNIVMVCVPNISRLTAYDRLPDYKLVKAGYPITNCHDPEITESFG